MKKNIIYIIMLLGLVLFPFNTFAREIEIGDEKYNVNYYLDVLKDEGIEPTVSDFTENKDKVNIYLFYGKGCEHCDNLLKFLNSITPEFKDYFNVVGFEIYGDEKNSALLTELAKNIGEANDGVPFIFVGDKYFSGYSEEYNDAIKEAIKSNYDVKPSERQDVMSSYSKSKQSSSHSISTGTQIMILNIILTLASTIIIIVFVNIKINSLDIKKK